MQPPAEPDRPSSELEAAAAPAAPPIRASDRERDAAVRQLRDAFAEGRLDDQEFDQRMRAALLARTRDQLERVLADLPRSGGLAAVPVQSTGRLLLALKGGLQRGGRWRVPERLNAVAYKGDCELDLRAAELTADSTTIRAVAYKGRVEIVVPPGVRVRVHGYAYGGHWADRVPDLDLPADAPLVQVRAVAYKGVVEARPTPAPLGEITRD